MTRRSFVALLVCGAALLVATGATHADTLRCESNGGSYRACPVDTRGGVRLSRQLSSQGCWQGDTWGYDRHRIWVNRGCRAEFHVGSGASDSDKVAGAIALGVVAAAIIASNHDDRDSYRDDYRSDYRDSYRDDGYEQYGGDPRRTLRCESNGGRMAYCSLPGRGHVEIYKQLSSSSCSYGRSWGITRSQVWVDHGCRAEFAIY